MIWTTLLKTDLEINSFRVTAESGRCLCTAGTTLEHEAPILYYACPTFPESTGPCWLFRTGCWITQRAFAFSNVPPTSLHYTFRNSTSILTTHRQTLYMMALIGLPNTLASMAVSVIVKQAVIWQQSSALSYDHFQPSERSQQVPGHCSHVSYSQQMT